MLDICAFVKASSCLLFRLERLGSDKCVCVCVCESVCVWGGTFVCVGCVYM